MTHPPSTPPQPGPRKRDPRGTRDRLVRAALDLFTSLGYHASTTPEIARRAGVAEGTIYRHFESKQHLLNEIYRAAVRLLITHVKDSSPSMRCQDRLQQVASSWRELAIRDPNLIKLVFLTRHERLLDSKSRDTYRELRQEIWKMIASGKAAGDVRPGAVEVWTDVWLGLVVLALDRLASREWTAQQPAASQVFEAAWDAIRVREARLSP